MEARIQNIMFASASLPELSVSAPTPIPGAPFTFRHLGIYFGSHCKSQQKALLAYIWTLAVAFLKPEQ